MSRRSFFGVERDDVDASLKHSFADLAFDVGLHDQRYEEQKHDCFDALDLLEEQRRGTVDALELAEAFFQARLKFVRVQHLARAQRDVGAEQRKHAIGSFLGLDRIFGPGDGQRVVGAQPVQVECLWSGCRRASGTGDI